MAQRLPGRRGREALSVSGQAGFHVMSSMSRRFGWTSLAGRRLLDFGCGVDGYAKSLPTVRQTAFVCRRRIDD